ncbi:MAG: hypothetical protein WB919_19830 [Candidatus Sulfotelmatobacter sp.]
MNDTNYEKSNGSNDNKAQNGKFDWVTQRSSCSLPNVFKDLRSQVEQDVKTRDSLRPNYAPYEFSVSDVDAGFRVLLKAKELEMAVTFILAEHAILVRDDKGVEMFQVTLTFNDRGECKLNVNGEERDFWQVRRMALEDLMFRSY